MKIILISIFILYQSIVTISRTANIFDPVRTKSRWNFTKPPPAKYGFNKKYLETAELRFQMWNPESGANIWEYSGLFEGDIMLYEDTPPRNGIRNESLHWPNATVPFFIDENDFNVTEIATILKSMQEFHNRTCIRFRPYKKTDKNWVIIKGNDTGCWSSVGMRREGQVVNLNRPRCVRHGIVLHELLHAVGFYHQQSATERDDYVKILWENIEPGHEHNFNKYKESHITSFDVEYDYGSIMHYSSKAFSKNGNPTIIPLEKDVHLGQREKLSNKDVIKLNKMYENSCHLKPVIPTDLDDWLEEIIKIFETAILDLLE